MKCLLVAIFLSQYTSTVFGQHPYEKSSNYVGRNRTSRLTKESFDFWNNFNLFENVEGVEEIETYLMNGGATRKKILPVVSSAIDLYLPTHTSSPQCISALEQLKHPENLGLTARMVDSWGKFPDGIYTGNYRPLGIFEECLKVDNDTLKGKYCYVHIRKNPTGENDARLDPQLSIIFVDKSSLMDSFAYGTCMPQTCTEADLLESLSVVLKPTHSSFLSCVSGDRESFTAGDISLIVFLSILGLIILISTLVDLYSTAGGRINLNKSNLEKMKAFSVSTNMKKLFDITTSTPKGNITCLHGIRTFSMVWVLTGHQYLFPLPNTSNINDIPEKTDGILFQIILDAFFCVDSFFFLSGLLVGYLTFKYMSKNDGKMNWFQYYVHRYLRLTPAIAITAWFQATIARFFIHGPYQDSYSFFTDNCRNKWWTDIVYVNNYAVSLTEPGKGDCIPQAWYTATDTQIFIFMPLVMIPLYHYGIWGKIFLGFLTLASCIIPGSITVGLDMPPFDIFGLDDASQAVYWKYLYTAPFSRASPYLIGIGVGYFIFVWGDKALKLEAWHVVIGWLLSLVMTSTLVFGVWKYNILTDPKTEYSFFFQFFYGGFSSALWGISLAWIVIACHYGYGGPVNWFLSHPLFQPLSKLSYPMYILGMGVQCMIMYSTKEQFYFTHLNKILEICGSLFIVIISATILSLIIEFPVMNLEKEFLRKPVSDKLSKLSNEKFAKETHIRLEHVDLEKVEDFETNQEVQTRFKQYP